MKNKLSDLNNHLFTQLERLNEEDLAGDKLKQEIERSKALSGVATNIINNAKLVLDAAVAAKEWGISIGGLPLIGNQSDNTNGGATK